MLRTGTRATVSTPILRRRKLIARKPTYSQFGSTWRRAWSRPRFCAVCSLRIRNSATEVDGKPVPPHVDPTYYFRFYLSRALEHAGMGDQYVSQLGPWYDMLRLGLSTWAENPGTDPLRLPRMERQPELRFADVSGGHSTCLAGISARCGLNRIWVGYITSMHPCPMPAEQSTQCMISELRAGMQPSRCRLASTAS